VKVAAARFRIPAIALLALLSAAPGLAQDGGPPQSSGADGRPNPAAARAPAFAAPTPEATGRTGRTQFALRTGREQLSNGSPDWSDTGVELVHEFDKRKILSGSVVESSRFGLRDQTVMVEGYYPFGARTTGYLMAAASDTHRVLPRAIAQAQLAYALVQGWGVMAGLRHANYNTTSVDIADLTLERYFSSFRAAVTVFQAHSSTAGSASSYRLQFSYYYGDEDRVQFLYSNGTEVDRPTDVDLVLATRVRSSAIFGRHWIADAWALDYGAGRTTQGTVNRTAVSVGLRYRF
jgi:YaiO family outer membrane protein